MKKILTVLAVVLFCSSGTILAQQSTKLIVLDEMETNLKSHQEEFRGFSNVYVTSGIKQNALVQIAEAIGTQSVDQIEIYVMTKPGAIVFSSVVLNVKNLKFLESDLKQLATKVKTEIIIYADVNVFEGEEGVLLKAALESATGKTFTFKSLK